MMMDRELWGEVFQVMKSNRLRTLLTACLLYTSDAADE